MEHVDNEDFRPKFTCTEKAGARVALVRAMRAVKSAFLRFMQSPPPLSHVWARRGTGQQLLGSGHFMNLMTSPWEDWSRMGRTGVAALLLVVTATLCAWTLSPCGRAAPDARRSGRVDGVALVESNKNTKLASLMRMLRRSRDKLHVDQEKLKLQDGVARLRENSLLRILAREKAALKSRS
jgi:hypothetical protein